MFHVMECLNVWKLIQQLLTNNYRTSFIHSRLFLFEEQTEEVIESNHWTFNDPSIAVECFFNIFALVNKLSSVPRN